MVKGTFDENHARTDYSIKCVSSLQPVLLWPQNIILVVFVFKIIKRSTEVPLKNDVFMIDL